MRCAGVAVLWVLIDATNVLTANTLVKAGLENAQLQQLREIGSAASR